jgi:hypothetical protein
VRDAESSGCLDPVALITKTSKSGASAPLFCAADSDHQVAESFRCLRHPKCQAGVGQW